MRTERLKPAPGLFVRDESGARHMSPEGEDVPMTAYYRRLKRAGDLVEADPEPKPKRGN